MEGRTLSAGASIEIAGASIESIMRLLTNEVCIELTTIPSPLAWRRTAFTQIAERCCPSPAVSPASPCGQPAGPLIEGHLPRRPLGWRAHFDPFDFVIWLD